jgi:hypothetical protein
MTKQPVLARSAEARSPSNNAFQPTPLRGPKIGGILQPDFVLILVPIYQCGAAECWPFGGSHQRQAQLHTYLESPQTTRRFLCYHTACAGTHRR